MVQLCRVVEYDDYLQILKMQIALPKPLAIYLFTNNRAIYKKFVLNTISGAVCWNNTVVQAAQESLPFGGIGASGMGAYRGKYGFLLFSHLKPIYKQSMLEFFTRFYPPVKQWQNKILNFMIK